MLAKFKYLSYSENRKPMLTFEVERVNNEELDSYKDKELELTVKPRSKKRSLTANRYMWALCREIGNALNISDREVYRNAIRNVGVYQDFGNLTPQNEATLKVAWGRQGIGWVTERLDYEPDGNNVILRCYYGSSDYNSKQMSKLIDDLKQDAEQLGINTMTDKEIALLIEQWDKEKR